MVSDAELVTVTLVEAMVSQAPSASLRRQAQ